MWASCEMELCAQIWLIWPPTGRLQTRSRHGPELPRMCSLQSRKHCQQRSAARLRRRWPQVPGCRRCRPVNSERPAAAQTCAVMLAF